VSPIPGHYVRAYTSSIKPEVHNVSQPRENSNEPRTQVYVNTNCVYGRTCSSGDMLANRQTDMVVTILRSPIGCEVISRTAPVTFGQRNDARNVLALHEHAHRCASKYK